MNPEPIHLALGDCAAGCLREACRSHGLVGEVATIPDDLGHGPLGDGVARIDYLRACHTGYDDWRVDDDAFAPWREWLSRLGRRAAWPTVIWSGRNASEAVLLSMACWWLQGLAHPVWVVTTPEDGARCHVAEYPPQELATLFRTRRPLPEDERSALAADFVALRDDPRPRRRWVNNRVTSAPVDVFDHVVLAACGTSWRPAVQVVSTAMQQCQRCDSVSDLFLCARLQALIDDGRVEADGPRLGLHAYAVRRA